MARTVILVDGEYLRKIFDNANYRADISKVVKRILEVTDTHENELLRVYYYTSPPYQPANPTPDEKERYISFQRFESFLRRQDNFELRLGRTEKRGNVFEQKMVDVLMSIDLVGLSAASKVETAILVTGDSDLVPAVKKAKDSAVRVILCCSADRREYHENLWNEADRRIPINKQFMQECSY